MDQALRPILIRLCTAWMGQPTWTGLSFRKLTTFHSVRETWKPGNLGNLGKPGDRRDIPHDHKLGTQIQKENGSWDTKPAFTKGWRLQP